MSDVGITRIDITDKPVGRGANRFTISNERKPAADSLYRFIFSRLGTPLLDGIKSIKCTSKEFMAGYDHSLGIDLILTLQDERQLTMQEKFLTANFKTVTVEYYQNPKTEERGDWFNLKAQLYFVGYDRRGALDFQEWILLRWSAVPSNINWWIMQNRRDGARANFKCANFSQFKGDCVIACSDNFPGIPHPIRVSMYPETYR